jgi:hypothetical protein
MSYVMLRKSQADEASQGGAVSRALLALAHPPVPVVEHPKPPQAQLTRVRKAYPIFAAPDCP